MGRKKKVEAQLSSAEDMECEEATTATGFSKYFASGGYFATEPNGKQVIQSLTELDLPSSTEDCSIRILADLPSKNVNQKEKLRVLHEEKFHSWAFQLRQGFSLLFYGYGSKRQLLDKFARTTLEDGGVLSVNGLAIGLTARQVLLKVASMLRRGTPQYNSSLSDAALLQSISAGDPSHCCYLLIHNIEGLRDPASHVVLSELAACPGVHVIASFDHVNTPLLWDKQTASRFNWMWHDVANYMPYVHEPRDVQSLLVGRSEENAFQGASMVLRTLVPKAREVFRIIAKYQLEDPETAGVSFQVLFRDCRERFLVQNEVTLKAHLGEFKDHELVHTRRGKDGNDLLGIPLETDVLLGLLEELEKT